MKIDETNSKLKEYLISNQKTEHVKMFAETHETLKQLTSELTDVLSHPEITLGISGGTLFSLISYEIVEYLIKKGIKINDIVANSGGSLVGTLVATHNIKKEYLDNVFSNVKLTMSKFLKIPSMVLGLMLPFVCEFYYRGEKIDIKDLLVNHSEDLLKQLSHEKIFQDGKIPEEIIKKAVVKVIVKNSLYPDDSNEDVYNNLSVHKMTFNDIKKNYGVDFKVMGSVVKGSLDLKTLKGRKDLRKLTQFKKVEQNGKDFLQDITFTGSFPVVDSLVVSTYGLPQKVSVKGKMVRALDGMPSWNDFPYTESHYAGHDEKKPIVLIHTPGITPVGEENKGLWPKQLSYGKNQYVITPNLDGRIDNLHAHFDSKYIPSIRKIARELIEGEPESELPIK